MPDGAPPVHRSIPGPVGGPLAAVAVPAHASLVGLGQEDAERPVAAFFAGFRWVPDEAERLTAEAFLSRL